MVNKAVIATRINNMIKGGRKEITTKNQLEKYPIGSLISYMNNNSIFRPGGFIIKFYIDYFIYVSSDFSTKYRARYSHIQKMWVGTIYSTKKDIVSIVKATQTKTNFPVAINNVIIYYGSNTFDADRFKNTDKYKKIIRWCEYFDQPT